MTTVYGDVERFKHHVIEYSFIKGNEFLHGFICPQLDQKELEEFTRQSHYSHCIDYYKLTEVAESPQMTHNKIQAFFSDVGELVENSQTHQMDVANFVQKFNIDIKFTSKPLPQWTDRIKLPSFQMAKFAKDSNFMKCPIHTKKFYASGKSETNKAKAYYGHHCAFYDCYMLSLPYYLKFNASFW